MAADIVPIRLRLTKGDVYTLWAPRWRADGDEWEAFLGKDEDLYVFESVATWSPSCGPTPTTTSPTTRRGRS